MNRKRMPFVLAFVAVLVLAALGWLLPLSKNSQAAPVPAPDASFKGKLLLVNTMMSTFILEKAQVQKIGDRAWLTGKGAADGRIGDWCKGRTVRLQMEQIVSITEFDDLKDAKKAAESGIGGPTTVTAPIGGAAYTLPGIAPVAIQAVPAVPALAPPQPPK